jgi:hypothetical protein
MAPVVTSSESMKERRPVSLQSAQCISFRSKKEEWRGKREGGYLEQ